MNPITPKNMFARWKMFRVALALMIFSLFETESVSLGDVKTKSVSIDNVETNSISQGASASTADLASTANTVSATENSISRKRRIRVIIPSPINYKEYVLNIERKLNGCAGDDLIFEYSLLSALSNPDEEDLARAGFEGAIEFGAEPSKMWPGTVSVSISGLEDSEYKLPDRNYYLIDLNNPDSMEPTCREAHRMTSGMRFRSREAARNYWREINSIPYIVSEGKELKPYLDELNELCLDDALLDHDRQQLVNDLDTELSKWVSDADVWRLKRYASSVSSMSSIECVALTKSLRALREAESKRISTAKSVLDPIWRALGETTGPADAIPGDSDRDQSEILSWAVQNLYPKEPHARYLRFLWATKNLTGEDELAISEATRWIEAPEGRAWLTDLINSPMSAIDSSPVIFPNDFLSASVANELVAQEQSGAIDYRKRVNVYTFLKEKGVDHIFSEPIDALLEKAHQDAKFFEMVLTKRPLRPQQEPRESWPESVSNAVQQLGVSEITVSVFTFSNHKIYVVRSGTKVNVIGAGGDFLAKLGGVRNYWITSLGNEIYWLEEYGQGRGPFQLRKLHTVRGIWLPGDTSKPIRTARLRITPSSTIVIYLGVDGCDWCRLIRRGASVEMTFQVNKAGKKYISPIFPGAIVAEDADINDPASLVFNKRELEELDNAFNSPSDWFKERVWENYQYYRNFQSMSVASRICFAKGEAIREAKGIPTTKEKNYQYLRWGGPFKLTYKINPNPTRKEISHQLMLITSFIRENLARRFQRVSCNLESSVVLRNEW